MPHLHSEILFLREVLAGTQINSVAARVPLKTEDEVAKSLNENTKVQRRDDKVVDDARKIFVIEKF